MLSVNVGNCARVVVGAEDSASSRTDESRRTEDAFGVGPLVRDSASCFSENAFVCPL